MVKLALRHPLALLVCALVCSFPLFAQGNAFPGRGDVGVGTDDPTSHNPASFSRYLVIEGDRSNVPSGREPGTPAIVLVETADKFGDPGESRWSIGVCSNGALCVWDERDSRLSINRHGRVALNRLEVAGETTTDVLTITGGGDVAERFAITGEPVVPGTVVSIDPVRAGGLRVAERAYDRTVAGVVSGAGGLAPGLTLQATGTAEGHPVALTGRVYCLADTGNGPIRPGDLLTTSDVPGHAMRADDPVRTRGAVLGKAMTALEEGRGRVLVLVTLQ